jgi:hypothetical protein
MIMDPYGIDPDFQTNFNVLVVIQPRFYEDAYPIGRLASPRPVSAGGPTRRHRAAAWW